MYSPAAGFQSPAQVIRVSLGGPVVAKSPEGRSVVDTEVESETWKRSETPLWLMTSTSSAGWSSFNLQKTASGTPYQSRCPSITAWPLCPGATPGAYQPTSVTCCGVAMSPLPSTVTCSSDARPPIHGISNMLGINRFAARFGVELDAGVDGVGVAVGADDVGVASGVAGVCVAAGIELGGFRPAGAVK